MGLGACVRRRSTKAVHFVGLTRLLAGCLAFFLVAGCTSELLRSEEIHWTPWRPGPIDGTIIYAKREECKDFPSSIAPPGTPYCAGIRLFLEVNGRRREIRVTDAATRRSGREGNERPFIVSGNGRRLVYFSGRLRRYVSHDLPSGHVVELRDMENIAVSDDGDLVAFTAKGKVHITDVADNRTFRLSKTCGVIGLGTVIVGEPCGNDGRYPVFNRKGKRVGTVNAAALSSVPNRGMVTPDAKRAVAVYDNGFGGDHDVLVVRDAGTAKVLKIIYLPPNEYYWSLLRVSGTSALVYDDTFLTVDLKTGVIHKMADQPDFTEVTLGLPVLGQVMPPVTPSGKPPAFPDTRIATAFLTRDPGPWQLATVTGQRVPVPQALPAWGMFAISRDGHWVAYGRQSDMRLVAQHLPSNRVVVASELIDPGTGLYGPSPEIHFAPDGRYLAFQEREGAPIQVTDLKTGRKTAIEVGSDDRLDEWRSSSLAVRRLVLRDDDTFFSEMRIMSPAGRLLRRMALHEADVSPDGKRMIPWNESDETLRIVDLATKRGKPFKPTLPDGWMLDYAFGWASNDDVLVGMWRPKDGNNWGYAVVNLSTGKVRVLPSQDPPLELKTIVFGDVL